MTRPAAVRLPPARAYRDRGSAAALLLAAAALLQAAAAQRAGNGGGYREAPTVVVRRQGAVSGLEVPLNKIGHRAWTYLGIPYARPPVGDLRFAPPDVDPPPAWDGVRNGSAHMPACIQDQPARQHPVHRLFAAFASPAAAQLRTSEDCLYLNVYRPEGAVPEEKFPVMVWFHPGDFHWGAPVYWDASVLAARHKVIVVTMAYRLSVLGFYTDNTADAAGNWGLLDQAAALDWVRRNIDSFGGAAHNVTAFGQGAGAVSVGLHAVSPGSRDRFHRAISMSGNALLRSAVDAAGGPDPALLDALTEKFNCFRNTLTGCLRNVDAAALVQGGGSALTRWRPVVDGPALFNDTGGREPFLPDEPAALMDDGRWPAVPHMVGYNHMEDAFETFDKTADAGAGSGADGGAEGLTRERFEALVRDIVTDDFADDEARRQQALRRKQQLQQQESAGPPVSGQDDSVSPDGGGGGVTDGYAADENCTLDADFAVATVVMRYARRTDDPETLRRNFAIMSAGKAYGATGYRVAGYVSRRNAPAYVYRYEYKLRAAKALPAAAEWMDAPHGAELPMVWGMPYWPAAGTVDWTAADRRMSDVMMALWTNFAKHADPVQRTAATTAVANVRWDGFQPLVPRLMVLDKVPNMSAPEQDPEFWNEYYPKLMAVSLQCCPAAAVDSAAAASPLRNRRAGHSLLLALLLLSPFVAASRSPWLA